MLLLRRGLSRLLAVLTIERARSRHEIESASQYKTTYHVANWPEYERSLVQRGDVTLWLSTDAIDAWTPRPSGRRGGQRKFSDHAIETALTLRLVFGLPLRQAEGFLRSVLSVMRINLDTPDHTTLSAEPAPGRRVSPRSGQRTHPSHCRQLGSVVCRRRRVGRRETRRTRHACLEEAPSRRGWIRGDRRTRADRREHRRCADRSHAD